MSQSKQQDVNQYRAIGESHSSTLILLAAMCHGGCLVLEGRWPANDGNLTVKK